MNRDRLLLVGAVYHAVLGLVFTLLPGDAARFLAVDEPENPALWMLAAAPQAVCGALLQWARQDTTLRPGLLAAVRVFDLSFGALLAASWALWDTPWLMLGPALAAGLWAWLLWDDGGAPA